MSSDVTTKTESSFVQSTILILSDKCEIFCTMTGKFLSLLLAAI